MSPTLAVFVKECRESLRDKRVLLNALVLGPLFAPLLFVGLLRFTIGRQIEQADKPLPVVVIGAERAPDLVTALKQQGMEMLPPVGNIENAVRVAWALRITDGFADDWRAGRRRSTSSTTPRNAMAAARCSGCAPCCRATPRALAPCG